MNRFVPISILISLPLAAHALDVDRIMNDDRGDGVHIVRVEDRPTEARELMAEYDFDARGTPLNHGEAIYLKIPANLAARPIDFISVAHRQDPLDENECPGGAGAKTDCKPGYTSLEVYSEGDDTHEAGWRCWGGRGSGPCNSKFAEIRATTPETDNLYEWSKKGHVGVHGGFSKSPLRPVFLRVRSVGPDQVLVHKVIVKVMPPTPDAFDTTIFARGLEFGDFQTAKGRRYPGDASRGDYGESLDLSRHFAPRHRAIPDDWTTGRGSIQFPLRAGKRLISIDLAVGDMRPVPSGSDPEKFRGGAVVTIDLYRHGVLVETLMKEENVGENGLLRASPKDLHDVVQDGDLIRVTVPRGEAHVMGLRVGYGD